MTSSPVEVWVVPVDVERAEVELLAAVLDEDELDRAEQLRALARRRFVVAHGALRHVLASYVDVSPARVRFAEPGEHGRPELAGHDPPSFNLSHSGELALVAVGTAGPVGVDVERHSSRPFERLAARSFSEVELAGWQQASESERQVAFHRLWCRKEAVLKSTGRGLASLRTMTATPAPAHWTVADLAVRDGYSAAVALPHPDVPVVTRYWAPGDGGTER